MLAMALAGSLVLPASSSSPAQATGSAAGYGCNVTAGYPDDFFSGGNYVAQGDGSYSCGANWANSNSKACLRRHKSWSPDWQGACRYFSGPFGSPVTYQATITGSRKYRTRIDLRVLCNCLVRAESGWITF